MRPARQGSLIVFPHRKHCINAHCVNQSPTKIATRGTLGAKSGHPITDLGDSANSRLTDCQGAHAAERIRGGTVVYRDYVGKEARHESPFGRCPKRGIGIAYARLSVDASTAASAPKSAAEALKLQAAEHQVEALRLYRRVKGPPPQCTQQRHFSDY